jgi:hypothetical protein
MPPNECAETRERIRNDADKKGRVITRAWENRPLNIPRLNQSKQVLCRELPLPIWLHIPLLFLPGEIGNLYASKDRDEGKGLTVT